MNKNNLISVCTVLHDCSSIVADFLEDISRVLDANYSYYEIVLVDNGSNDDTIIAAKASLKKFRNVRLIVLSKQYEPQIAYTAALENCIGDYVVIMDINTDSPQAIPGMVSAAIGGADTVTAALPANCATSSMRALPRLFYKISNRLTENRIDQNWTNYICFSRKMLNAILQIKDRVRYLKYFHSDIGYQHLTIEVPPLDPPRQLKGKPFLESFFFAIDTLVSNSVKLMRVAVISSFVMSAVSFCYIPYVLMVWLLKSDVAPGWASTSIILSTMFGVLFFILFIISEYLSFIYKESSKGPLYHIAEEASSSVLFSTITDKNVIIPEA